MNLIENLKLDSWTALLRAVEEETSFIFGYAASNPSLELST